MRYCTQCGRQLQDGEVCTCQTEETKLQNETAQAAMQTTSAQQAASQTAAQQASRPIITKEQATEISKGMLAYAKTFFANPAKASESVVGEHSLVTVVGLVVVNAALELVYTIVNMIIRTAKWGGYGAGTWLKSIFCVLLWWVAIPAAFAGLVWVCAKLIEKQDVSFKKALSVFAIPAIPLLAFTLISILGLVLTHSFFGVIFSFIRAAIGGMMLYLTGIGIVKVIPRSDRFVYSIGVICAGLWFVNWLVMSAIF